MPEDLKNWANHMIIYADLILNQKLRYSMKEHCKPKVVLLYFLVLYAVVVYDDETKRIFSFS
jgi:hypothetical protein